MPDEPTAVGMTATPATVDPADLLQTAEPITLTHIRMASAEIGWGIGYQAAGIPLVLQTQNGGTIWYAAGPPHPVSSGLDRLPEPFGFFPDALHAWVIYAPPVPTAPAGAPVVWRTQDGGATWEAGEVLDIADLNENFSPLFMGFSSPEDGWLAAGVGVGMNHQYIALYRTADGGVTWERLLDPYTGGSEQACGKSGLEFLNAELGWLTIDCHGVAPGVTFGVTEDGGSSWELQDLPVPADLPGGFDHPNLCRAHSPYLYSANSGRVGVSCQRYLETPEPGGEAFTSGPHYLYRTEDGGQTWQIQAYPGGGLQFTGPRTVWALGSEIHYSADGGESWELRSQVTWEAEFSIVGDDRLWAIARAGDEIAFVHSQNGGRRWELLPTYTGADPRPPALVVPPHDSLQVTPPAPDWNTRQELVSPSGDWLAAATYTELAGGYRVQLTVTQTDGPERYVVIDTQGEGLGYVYPRLKRWSADGRYLDYAEQVAADGCGELYPLTDHWGQLDVETGEVSTLELPPGRGHAFIDDGSLLAYFPERAPLELWVMDFASRQESRIPFDLPKLLDRDEAPLIAGDIVWAPEAGSLVFAAAEGELCGTPRPVFHLVRVDLSTGVGGLLLADHPGWLRPLVWRLPGQLLVGDMEGYRWWMAVPQEP